MILYDWKKIFKEANGKANECWRIFKMLAQSQIPRNKYDLIYYYSNMRFSGESFLMHPDVLIYNAWQYSNYDLCVYLALASLRPLAEYKASGKLTLDLLHSSIDPGQYLNDPSLLPIKDGQIYFPYEESPSKKELH